MIAVSSSFMQMRRGYILVLDDAGEPELTAAMCDEVKPKSRSLVPQALIDQVVATGVPLVIENISTHPLFTGSAYLHAWHRRGRPCPSSACRSRSDGKVKGVPDRRSRMGRQAAFRLSKTTLPAC